MTEQEIINILKENKKKGIAFGFMPKEVKEWCSKNDSNLVYYSVNGTWFSGDNRSIFDMNEIVALPDSFQIQQEKNGEWVEFDIDQKGNFHCFMDGDIHYFFWANWNVFLFEADSSGYTAFGGWQYKDSKRWYLAPAVKLQDGDLWNSYVIEESGEATPAVPTKIRFWKESR